MNTQPDNSRFMRRQAKSGQGLVPHLSRLPVSRPPLGQILVEIGALSSGDMLRAIAMRAREEARFGDILVANGMVSETDLFKGLAIQFNCDVADLKTNPPDPRLVDEIGVDICLQHGFVPWRRMGACRVVATTRPEKFSQLIKHLPPEYSDALMALVPTSVLNASLVKVRQSSLVTRAETRVDADASCRNWNTGAALRILLGMICIFAALAIIAPTACIFLIFSWALLSLVVNTGLKFSAAIATLRDTRQSRAVFTTYRHRGAPKRLPVVSVMVPLFREREIAGRLIRRLSRLTYPRELLDICLVIERGDWQTERALANADIPPFIRTVNVPVGSLNTKPRALNFALDFCRGSIVGIYDAEDAPEPDQIHKVVRRFQDASPEVACLQGVLDFYNARCNWLSRCFAVEYATWFRVVLPGLERLGFVIPLGGTTLFFRKDALVEIGGWDAHNVTEDADLGVRLARRGYRTELVPTVTEEEANCRAWPWVRQRSRWLKGYAMTWAVHMRSPRKLLHDLGAWRFMGVQLLFLGAISQFLLAPLLWSFWAIPLGLPHPLIGLLPTGAINVLVATFIVSELVSIGVGILATSGARHRWLWPWVPTLHIYYPLGSLAAYKAIWEIFTKPFYWDKTQHGHDLPPLVTGPKLLSGPGPAPQD